MKKGIIIINWYLVGFILLLLFLAGMIPLLTKLFGSRMEEALIVEECRQSIYFNAETRLPVFENENVAIKCPTKYITIHEEYAEQEYETNPLDKTRGYQPVKIEDIKYKKTCDDEEDCMFRGINKIFADELARCWFVFHRGQRRVFSLYEKGKQCTICSVILFDNDMKKMYGSDGLIGMNYPESEDRNLDLYMRNNNVMKYTGTSNYYDYTVDLIDSTFGYPYYDYDVNSDWAVVFVALNEHNVNLILDGLWDKIKQKLSDFEPEDEGNFVNRLMLLRNEDVSRECDVWG